MNDNSQPVMVSESEELATLVAAVNEQLSDPHRNTIVSNGKGSPVRFELYHAGLSVCSQKVRTVLAEKSVEYVSHEMVILNSKGIYSDELTPAENYSPAYVRLRLFAAKELGSYELARGHRGVSSVQSEGFDACVVPTLVDHARSRVIVDSMRICEYLDQELPETSRLIPADNSKDVLEQVSIVDQTPQPGLLYGYHPDDDRRPDFIKGAMSDVYELKVQALEQLIAANSDDEEVVEAYRAKISKEQGGKQLQHDADFQHEIRAQTRELIANLEKQLTSDKRAWVCGNAFTLADVCWGVSLYRLHWLGLASLWQDLPRVQEYTRQLYQRASLRDAVICFPSPMPESPHTAGV